jgi:hypothetical protein
MGRMLSGLTVLLGSCQHKPALAPVETATDMPGTIQLPLFHVVGFTGHREIAGSERTRDAIRKALEWLEREHPANWIAVSSVAAGSDILFAEAAIEKGIAWHALMPLPVPMFREDFDDTEWRRADGLLKRATHVEFTSRSFEDSREHAYLDCGHETVNASDVIVAVWDGGKARGVGGTAEIVAYARKLGRPIVIIDPATLEVRRERFETFKTNDSETRFLRNLAGGGGGARVAETADAPEALVRLQAAADIAALAGSPRLRMLATLVIVFHSFAALIGTFNLSFQVGWTLFAWAEALLVGAGLTAAIVYRRSFRQIAWVRCRVVAEITRATIATWGLPQPPLFLREIEIPGIQRLLNSLRVLHQDVARTRSEALEQFRIHYLENRVEDQRRYYDRQIARALPRLRWLRAAFFIATTIGVGLTFMNAVLLTIGAAPDSEFIQAFGFGFLPVVLPAFAASCVSIISLNDLTRRVARYREMIVLLGVASTQVSSARTWSSLEREVNKCERLLLHEVLEWHTITSYSEAH